MIYTVTLNPSLDYMVTVKDFQVGMTNRTESEQLVAGGKGINVSTILNNLGLENIAMGFVAGFTGDEIERQLHSRGINTDFIKVKEGSSRINVKLTSIEGTEINGCGPKVSQQEADMLIDKLSELKKGDVLFLSGSVPTSLPKDIYSQMLARLQEKEVLSIVDTTGEALLKVLPYQPFLIKPNIHELGELFGDTLPSGQDLISYGQRLQEMGAQNVLISLAGDGAVLITKKGQVLCEEAPKGQVLNGVGAGDSMVAAFVAGWLEKQDYEYAFYMGLAAGSASAFSEELATKQEISKLFELLSTRRKKNADL